MKVYQGTNRSAASDSKYMHDLYDGARRTVSKNLKKKFRQESKKECIYNPNDDIDVVSHYGDDDRYGDYLEFLNPYEESLHDVYYDSIEYFDEYFARHEDDDFFPNIPESHIQQIS